MSKIKILPYKKRYESDFSGLKFYREMHECCNCYEMFERKMPIEKNIHRCPACKRSENYTAYPNNKDLARVREIQRSY